jgi:hypothetical protein
MEWKSGLYVTFIDFEKAFDSLNRKIIWRILEEYCIPQRIINLIEMMALSVYYTKEYYQNQYQKTLV